MDEDVYEEAVLKGLYALIQRFGSVHHVGVPVEDVKDWRQLVDLDVLAGVCGGACWRRLGGGPDVKAG